MSSLQNKYNLIKEGKGNKDGLLRESKRMFPNYIPNSANFNQAVEILKSRQIISENYVDLTPINSIGTTKKESFETAFETYLKEEAKAEEKKTSSEVTDVLAHQYDVRKEDELNNKIFDQLMAGYYAELKDPKNEGKTAEEIKDIVLKNLEKDPIHYVKDGQFGVKGLGYTDEAPGLGKPEEPTGKYKASGYGDLKESKEILKENKEIEFPEGLESYLKIHKLLLNDTPKDIFNKMTSSERKALENMIKSWEEATDDVKNSFTPTSSKQSKARLENLETTLKKNIEIYYKRINYDPKEEARKKDEKDKKAKAERDRKSSISYDLKKMRDQEAADALSEEAEIPSEEELTEMEDLVDAIADFSDNKEDCVKKVLTLCPEWKEHETTLLQLAEPKF